MPANLKVLVARDNSREWFKARIRARNLTQDDVARYCEVNIRTLRVWLSSGRISSDQVPGLCGALDVTSSELAEHFRIFEPQPYARRRVGALDKIGDITSLLRVVLESGCEKVTLVDLEVVAALPFNFSAGLSDDEVTAARTFLRARQKKKEK